MCFSRTLPHVENTQEYELERMAFSVLKTRNIFIFCVKFSYLIHPIQCSPGLTNRFLFFFTRSFAFFEKKTKKKDGLNFEDSPITQIPITNEIQFYRDSRNNFTQICFSEKRENYGPPLAIILPWKGLDETVLRAIIEFYGEKGFDILTVHLTTNQFLYPCMAGNAMNVVTDLLKYLNESHKFRPYIFHSFSIGVYIFGEMMAQFSEQYEIYRTMINNIKGCLWDSPVDIFAVRSCVGKFFYPNNYIKRLYCNSSVNRHFKKHYHDSVIFWLRSRDNFCNPIIRVPNVFFISYTDVLSNPSSLQPVQKALECNGISIYQKTWWDSQHGHHFEKYCYEYMHGMTLFFNLSSLFPDENGKYQSSYVNASLTNLRLRKAARENLSIFIDNKK